MTEANDNPYAPPQSSEEEPVFPSDDRPVEGYRHGKRVVLSVGAQLPRRCYFCNAPAEGFREITHQDWVKRRFGLPDVEARFWLCEKHRRWGAGRGYVDRVITLTGVVAFLAMYRNGLASWGGLALFGAGVFAVQFVVSYWFGPQVSSREFGKGHVKLRGAGKPFLESLPEWDAKQTTATQTPPP